MVSARTVMNVCLSPTVCQFGETRSAILAMSFRSMETVVYCHDPVVAFLDATTLFGNLFKVVLDIAIGSIDQLRAIFLRVEAEEPGNRKLKLTLVVVPGAIMLDAVAELFDHELLEVLVFGSRRDPGFSILQHSRVTFEHLLLFSDLLGVVLMVFLSLLNCPKSKNGSLHLLRSTKLCTSALQFLGVIRSIRFAELRFVRHRIIALHDASTEGSHTLLCELFERGDGAISNPVSVSSSHVRRFRFSWT
jgi:hypothetical protein